MERQFVTTQEGTVYFVVNGGRPIHVYSTRDRARQIEQIAAVEFSRAASIDGQITVWRTTRRILSNIPITAIFSGVTTDVVIVQDREEIARRVREMHSAASCVEARYYRRDRDLLNALNQPFTLRVLPYRNHMSVELRAYSDGRLLLDNMTRVIPKTQYRNGGFDLRLVDRQVSPDRRERETYQLEFSPGFKEIIEKYLASNKDADVLELVFDAGILPGEFRADFTNKNVTSEGVRQELLRLDRQDCKIREALAPCQQNECPPEEGEEGPQPMFKCTEIETEDIARRFSFFDKTLDTSLTLKERTYDQYLADRSCDADTDVDSRRSRGQVRLPTQIGDDTREVEIRVTDVEGAPRAEGDAAGKATIPLYGTIRLRAITNYRPIMVNWYEGDTLIGRGASIEVQASRQSAEERAEGSTDRLYRNISVEACSVYGCSARFPVEITTDPTEPITTPVISAVQGVYPQFNIGTGGQRWEAVLDSRGIHPGKGGVRESDITYEWRAGFNGSGALLGQSKSIFQNFTDLATHTDNYSVSAIFEGTRSLWFNIRFDYRVPPPNAPALERISPSQVDFEKSKNVDGENIRIISGHLQTASDPATGWRWEAQVKQEAPPRSTFVDGANTAAIEAYIDKFKTLIQKVNGLRIAHLTGERPLPPGGNEEDRIALNRYISPFSEAREGLTKAKAATPDAEYWNDLFQFESSTKINAAVKIFLESVSLRSDKETLISDLDFDHQGAEMIDVINQELDDRWEETEEVTSYFIRVQDQYITNIGPEARISQVRAPEKWYYDVPQETPVDNYTVTLVGTPYNGLAGALNYGASGSTSIIVDVIVDGTVKPITRITEVRTPSVNPEAIELTVVLDESNDDLITPLKYEWSRKARSGQGYVPMPDKVDQVVVFNRTDFDRWRRLSGTPTPGPVTVNRPDDVPTVTQGADEQITFQVRPVGIHPETGEIVKGDVKEIAVTVPRDIKPIIKTVIRTDPYYATGTRIGANVTYTWRVLMETQPGVPPAARFAWRDQSGIIRSTSSVLAIPGAQLPKDSEKTWTVQAFLATGQASDIIRFPLYRAATYDIIAPRLVVNRVLGKDNIFIDDTDWVLLSDQNQNDLYDYWILRSYTENGQLKTSRKKLGSGSPPKPAFFDLEVNARYRSEVLRKGDTSSLALKRGPWTRITPLTAADLRLSDIRVIINSGVLSETTTTPGTNRSRLNANERNYRFVIEQISTVRARAFLRGLLRNTNTFISTPNLPENVESPTIDLSDFSKQMVEAFSSDNAQSKIRNSIAQIIRTNSPIRTTPIEGLEVSTTINQSASFTRFGITALKTIRFKVTATLGLSFSDDSSSFARGGTEAAMSFRIVLTPALRIEEI